MAQRKRKSIPIYYNGERYSAPSIEKAKELVATLFQLQYGDQRVYTTHLQRLMQELRQPRVGFQWRNDCAVEKIRINEIDYYIGFRGRNGYYWYSPDPLAIRSTAHGNRIWLNLTEALHPARRFKV